MVEVDNKKDISNKLLEYLDEQRKYYQRGNKKIKESCKKKNFLSGLRFRKWELGKICKVFEVFLAIVGIIFIARQVTIMENQAQISTNQAEILERTTQSNKPDLFLMSSGLGETIIPIKKLNNFTMIKLAVTNLGKSTVPIASITFKDNSKAGRISSDFIRINNSKKKLVSWIIQDFDPLDYDILWFQFKQRESFEQNFPVGPSNLTFFINCPFCDNPKKEQNITICIYTNSSTIKEECGEEWKLKQVI